jgi:GTP cyclohydrolase I
MNFPLQLELVDVQNTPDVREFLIDQVGIKGIRHPIRFKSKDGEHQSVVAMFNMYVRLPDHVKGTHMSRFVEILNAPKRVFSLETFENLTREMLDKLDAKAGEIEMRFPFFINKTAPVSGVESLMDYDVVLTAKVQDNLFNLTINLMIPVTSLCPCSKKISEYGAHNQRSHVTITVNSSQYILLEELITLVENQASSQLYGLLKRTDEKYVTEYAYDHPKFVEDMVRDVAGELSKDRRIISYVVECENFESIHNHSAYAKIERTL